MEAEAEAGGGCMVVWLLVRKAGKARGMGGGTGNASEIDV